MKSDHPIGPFVDGPDLWSSLWRIRLVAALTRWPRALLLGCLCPFSTIIMTTPRLSMYHLARFEQPVLADVGQETSPCEVEWFPYVSTRLVFNYHDYLSCLCPFSTTIMTTPSLSMSHLPLHTLPCCTPFRKDVLHSYKTSSPCLTTHVLECSCTLQVDEGTVLPASYQFTRCLATIISRQCLHGGYSIQRSQRKFHGFDFCY